MNFDDMNIPQFGLAQSPKDAVNTMSIFLSLGAVMGVAATFINNWIVRSTIRNLNYELGEHFIEEVKRVNPE